MKVVDVRVISRGITGATRLDGNFQVIHKELSQDGRIALVCRDELGTHLVVYIRPEILEDVAPPAPAGPELAGRAETAVLERLVR
jgi:hypothetical protein